MKQVLFVCLHTLSDWGLLACKLPLKITVVQVSINICGQLN